ncbi:MAG: hypothetical protein IT374_03420 [Polyangiaceae bacterium]|nr:hypothetical protein [Polyangiaceae bacterium]
MKRLLILLCLPSLGALHAGCGSDATAADSTTGKRVRVHVDVAGAADARAPFFLGTGHSVTLTRAAVALDAVQIFDGPPAVAWAPRPRRTWSSWLLGTAHAHPGHYQAGNALGEVVAPGTFELLGAPTALGDGDGVTGTFRSARVTYSASSTSLGGAAVVAEGTAKKGDATLTFRLVAPRSQLELSLAGGRVEGCPFTEREVSGDLAATLTISPSAWFLFVDFGALSGGTAEAPVTLGPDSPQGVSFAVGVAQLSGYRMAATE